MEFKIRKVDKYLEVKAVVHEHELTYDLGLFTKDEARDLAEALKEAYDELMEFAGEAPCQK